MVSWTVYNFECADEAAREDLLDWFEANQPVSFPEDRYSVFAEIETGARAYDYPRPLTARASSDTTLYSLSGGGSLRDYRRG